MSMPISLPFFRVGKGESGVDWLVGWLAGWRVGGLVGWLLGGLEEEEEGPMR